MSTEYTRLAILLRPLDTAGVWLIAIFLLEHRLDRRKVHDDMTTGLSTPMDLRRPSYLLIKTVYVTWAEPIAYKQAEDRCFKHRGYRSDFSLALSLYSRSAQLSTAPPSSLLLHAASMSTTPTYQPPAPCPYSSSSHSLSTAPLCLARHSNPPTTSLAAFNDPCIPSSIRMSSPSIC